MDTQHIRFVRAVVEQGNISAASRELGTTQPALTKIISRVEDLVGVRLFDRSARGVSLTPFGRLFLEKTQVIEQQMMHLEQEVRARKSGISGTIALGVGQFWLGPILPRVIGRLSVDSPDIQVKVRTGPREELLQQLKLGMLDMVLGRITDDLPEQMIGEALAEVRLFLVARKGHPLEKRVQAPSLEELNSFGWILPPRADPTMRYAFTQHGLEPPTARVEVVSHNVIVGVLQFSDMVTIMPDITVNSLSPELCRLNVDWLEWTRDAGVISMAERTLLPCCSRFLALLREETAGEA